MKVYLDKDAAKQVKKLKEDERSSILKGRNVSERSTYTSLD